MTDARRRDGGHWLTVTVVAECYSVERAWVEEVLHAGLLGESRIVSGEPAIRTVMLERVAVIRRLQLQVGLDLAGVALLIDELG